MVQGRPTLTAALKAETKADSLHLTMLAEFQFSGGTVNFWLGHGDLSFDSKTWTGTGSFGGISTVEETSETRATGMQFRLTGVPLSIIAIALDQEYQGRSAKLWIAALDDDHKLIADPYLIFTGKMDTMDINENAQSADVTLTAENELIDLERAREFRLTPEDQRQYFPGDTFCDYVSVLQDVEIVWGHEKMPRTVLTPQP